MSGISGAPAKLSKEFVSSEQAITSGGLLTLAHLMGVKPKVIQFISICKTAEGGYAINDEIIVDTTDSGNAGNTGLCVKFDATNIIIRFGSAGTVWFYLDTSSGNRTALTNANWKLIVRAFA